MNVAENLLDWTKFSFHTTVQEEELVKYKSVQIQRIKWVSCFHLETGLPTVPLINGWKTAGEEEIGGREERENTKREKEKMC